MQANEKKLQLLGKEKEARALLRLGLPMMVGMMTSALYNLVDSYFIGKLGTSQMGAVTVVYPIGVVLLGLGLLFGSGAGSYVARLLGRKETERASECASTALVASVVTAAAVLGGMLLCLNPLLRLLGATQTMFPYARAYAAPFFISLLFNVFNITVNNIITSEGASFYSMMSMLIGGILNIILDPIFIYSLHMGVSGVSLATLIANIVSTVFFVAYLCGKKSNLRIRLTFFRWDSKLFLEIFKVGVPTMVYQLLCSVAMLLTNGLAAAFGDAAVAALGVVNRVLSLGMMAVMGFLKGYQPFIGYNYGAGNRKRMQKATRLALLWTSAFCMAFALLLIIGRTGVIHLFSKQDEQVLHIGAAALVYNAVTFVTLGVQTVYSTRYMGMGKALEGGLIALGRQGLFFLPLLFLLRYTLGFTGILLAQPAADLCSFLLVLALTLREKRREA